MAGTQPVGKVSSRSSASCGTVADRGAVVVGGSASGLLAAVHMARSGMPVRVLDQAQRIGSQDRTLIVTERFRQFLPPGCDGCVAGQVERYELYADGRVATLALEKPDLVIERSRLIADLAEAARGAGAQITLGSRFAGVEEESGRVTVSTACKGERSEFPVSVVVGADGAFSSVAKALGLPPLPTLPLVQAVVETPRDLPDGTSRIWFRPTDTSWFYWLIPSTGGRSVVGLIGEPGSKPRHLLDGFLAEKSLTPVGYQSARIPCAHRRSKSTRRVGAGRFFFVGDAAGHVKVSTVGGIVTGLAGAVATAEAIVGDRGSRALRKVESQLALHRLVRRGLARFDVDDYRRLFDSLDDKVLSVLAEGTREDAGTLLRQLLLGRPQLMGVALRAMYRRRSWEMGSGK
jgi:menaquinone-9 beta-reductase